nr:hypothetical protein [Nocardia pneumoniae]
MFVVTVTYTAPLADVDPLRPAHGDWLRQLIADRRLVLAGRRVPLVGGVYLAADMPREQLAADGTDRRPTSRFHSISLSFGPCASPQRGVQFAPEVSYAAAAARGVRVSRQDLHHDRAGQICRLLDVIASHLRGVAGVEFERSSRMGGRHEDVPTLSRLCQRVQVRGPSRMTGGARRFGRGLESHLSSCPRGPVRVECGRAYRFCPLASGGELAHLVEHCACTRIIRTVALENRQSGLRAGHSVARDLAQLGHAEFDRQVLVGNIHEVEQYR